MTKKDVKEFIRDSIEEIRLELMTNAEEGQMVRLSISLMIIDVIQSKLLSRLEKLEEGEEK